MNKMRMESQDLTQANIDKIAELFPGVITEAKDENGKLKRAVNFELLKQLLSSDVVDGDEAYEFTWVGKKASIVEAGRPIRKTLRPCKEESKNWESTENLYIEGDNLDVLKLLQESYLGKVKMIYIDPPYNTGNDFIYRDNFTMDKEDYDDEAGMYDDDGNKLFLNSKSRGRFHSEWCSMMYPRLVLARNLLQPDGGILISVDENEAHNLKKICDEVFGATNYAGEIVWKNSSKNDQAYISIQHEYILVYVKDKSSNTGKWVEPKEGTDAIFAAFESFRSKYGNNWKEIHKAALDWYKQFPESNPIYDCRHYSWMDEKGVYFPADISGPNFGQYRYAVIHPVTGKACKEPASGWRYPESTMLERIKAGLVHFGDDETTVPNNKIYLFNTLNQSLTSVKYKDGRVASKILTSLMETNCFTNPKDVSMLMRLIKAVGINSNEIVLDFFSGSAATAEAAMRVSVETKCKFIMVQIQENLNETLTIASGSAKTVLNNAIQLCDKLKKTHLLTEIGKERIRRAGEKIKADNAGKEGIEKLDIGFRVLKLDSTNMKDVYYGAGEYDQASLTDLISNIKDDRDDMDLLYGCLLEWGLPLSLPHSSEQIDGVTVHTYNNGDLIACFAPRVSETVVREIAKRQPLRVVFRDSSFADAPAKINVEEIFKLMAPNTTVKVI